jgi:hypothetical protein
MSDTKPPIPKFELTEEQLQKIGGGDCTLQEYVDILGQLKKATTPLVDFTSYVIERVATS